MDASEFVRGYSRFERLHVEPVSGTHRILSQLIS
jgi:hypothetical protein